MEIKEIQNDGFEKKGFKSLNFLGINDIWKDIKGLSRNFKLLLIIGAIIIVFFNFFDFFTIPVDGAPFHGEAAKWFAPLSQYWGVIDGKATVFGNSEGAAITVTILYSLNGLAAITGLFAIAMIVHTKTSQYFWGLVNAIFFGLFAITVGYMGDVIMNIILILGAPLGWYLMEIKKIVDKADEAKGWKYNTVFYALLLVLIGLAITMWYFLLPEVSGAMFGADNNPYNQVIVEGKGTNGETLLILDSMTNGANLVGYGMQLMNMGQQFYVWFFVNILKFLKFAGVAGPSTMSINMMIQFGVWFAMALVGLYKRNLESIFQKIMVSFKK